LSQQGYVASIKQHLEQLKHDFEESKSHTQADFVAKEKEIERLFMEWTTDWMDYYTVSRVLKPYVKKVLVVCGDDHRLNMSTIFPKFGFHLEYAYSSPTQVSCIPLPVVAQW